ncbi:hypothetical protein ACV3M9_13975 [Clostridium perfringens]|nr:hypothetical protein [Clostridium perfringens]
MILLKGLCLLLNIISLILCINLKRLIEKGEYIRENYEIRKVIIGPVVTLILLIIYILSNNKMFISFFVLFEVIQVIALSRKVFEVEYLAKDRIKYIDINELIFKGIDNNQSSYITMSKEFINALNSNDIGESLDEYKYKYKLKDIQMNYLLESVVCESNNIYTKYNSYIYINDELTLLEINDSIKKSNIKGFEFRNILILNEYEILEKIKKINEITEDSKLESSAYFLLMNYFKLKEYTTKLDENNYIEYLNHNSELFNIYFNELDKWLNRIKSQAIKISLKAIEVGVPIESISKITEVSLLNLNKFVNDKIDK